MNLADAAQNAQRLPFLIDNAIRNVATLAGVRARASAVNIHMLPRAPASVPPSPGIVTQRSGKLGDSVRVMPVVVTGSFDGGGAVYTVGLEAGGSTIPYAAAQELGASIPVRSSGPSSHRRYGPARSVIELPPRPYMGPGLADATEGVPAETESAMADVRAKVFGA